MFDDPKRAPIIRVSASALPLLPLAAMLLAACAPLDTGFRDPWHERVAAAGFVERQSRIGPVILDYAEGPDNGPPLLLLHAQHMDWFSYSRVLPALSEDFHVFAVSYHGHGRTKSPEDRMNAASIGSDLSVFIETVIGEPAFVTGNSSGGLLTTWLAANRPALVRAILLEDPPLLTAEFPRSKATVAYRTFATAHAYLSEGIGDGGQKVDFLTYWLNANKTFIAKRAGPNSLGLLLSSIERYRAANPGLPVELNYLPDILRLFIRGLDQYDPGFGDAFHDGRWNDSFGHEEALRRIECPVLLLHAEYEYLEDGTLNGAMDRRDAEKAMSSLSNGRYVSIDAQHTVHIDKPKAFVELARSFFLD